MLWLHRSERADRLVEVLADQLADPLPDPIEAEIVSVPTRGVERWISQRLSHVLGAVPAGGAGHGDGGGRPSPGGVCANIAFPFPGALVGEVVARVTGVDPAADPWDPQRAVWPLIEVIDAHWSDSELAPLRRHLEACSPGARPRRYAVARHLADLFDRYGVHRPAMVQEWAAGAGAGPEGLEWQPHLWRLLRRRIGTESPAERLSVALDLVAGGAELDLPQRLSVFGLTRLPIGHLQVLRALSVSRDVHLYLLHPSAALWDRLAAQVAGRPLGPRDQDTTRLVPRHPLLRSLAHDAREMQLVLASEGVESGRHYPVDAAEPVSLLQRLQSALRGDRAPEFAPPARAADDSICIHSCHGRSRQVEVLRDAILHRLADDPTLEPRDIVVMCPDIEEFAPLLQAAFGEGLAARGVDLRLRLADRSLRQTNPLLGIASRLMELAAARMTASELIDLASRPPVARRFRFDRDDLATIERWVAGTDIHWGLDASHRDRWQLGSIPEGTWQAGMDRVLLGVAMEDDGATAFGPTVPYGGLDGSSLELAGRLAELVERLRAAMAALAGPLPVRDWADSLLSATRSIACAGPGEVWQEEQLRSILAEAAERASGARVQLSLEEARSLLAGRLAGQPTRANFRTGDLTVCTLVPMRSVPHRVICLIGLDEGVFPRHPDLDGDDILLRQPVVGERDARSEDRQLLLDAILAATDALIITYSGRDERTNRVRPPCAPVAELLDVLSQMTAGRQAEPGRPLVVQQPLQAHDPLAFTPGACGHPGPWSFDPVQLAGCLAARHRRPPSPWLADPLPPLVRPVIGVEELVSFVQHPVRAFLRQRLSIVTGDRDGEISDELPLSLNPLDKWESGDRLLDFVLSGVPLPEAVAAERSRSSLPRAVIGRDPLDEIANKVDGLVSVIDGLGLAVGPASSCQVRVPIGADRVLTGSIPAVKGATISQFLYSKLAAKHRLAAWVRYLALTAERPDLPVGAVTVGRGERDSIEVARIDPVEGSADDRRNWALGQLRRLFALYDLGMTRPLPIMAKTSCAWAEARRRGLDEYDVRKRADEQWSSRFSEEDDDHRYVWGPGRPLLDFLREPIYDDEKDLGWPEGEASRFAGLARLLWDPLIDRERREVR